MAGFEREPFEVVVDEDPNIPGFRQMPFDFECPAFQSCFPFPKKFSVTMNPFAVAAVFGGVISQETEIKEIGGVGKKLEGREVPFVQSGGVRPNPADAVFF